MLTDRMGHDIMTHAARAIRSGTAIKYVEDEPHDDRIARIRRARVEDLTPSELADEIYRLSHVSLPREPFYESQRQLDAELSQHRAAFVWRPLRAL